MKIIYKEKDGWIYFYLRGRKRGWIREMITKSTFYEAWIFSPSGRKLKSRQHTDTIESAKSWIALQLKVLDK